MHLGRARTFINANLIRDIVKGDLKAAEIKILLNIFQCADYKVGVWTRQLKQEQIAKNIPSISRSTVSNLLPKLKAKEIIDIDNTSSKGNKYLVRTPKQTHKI